MNKKKILFMLDHILVPINTLTKPEDLQLLLEKEGFRNIKKLNRGSDNDAIEIKNRNQRMNENEKQWIFGDPELRYIVEK